MERCGLDFVTVRILREPPAYRDLDACRVGGFDAAADSVNE
jgi:hypothetical protein